ncbi:MAG: HdeD family acid-resistance protein [Oscillospiraceae bacterium]
MKQIEKFKKIFLSTSTLFVIAGLFLILNPQISQQAVGIIIGVVFIIFGIAKLLGFIFNIGLKSETFFDFINALLNIGLGMFVIYNHGAVLSAASMIIGIIVAFESVMKITTSFELKKVNYSKWQNELTFGIISLIFALFIIFNPFKSAMAVYVMIGIAMTAYGLFRLWCSWKLSDIFDALEPSETGTKSAASDVIEVNAESVDDENSNNAEQN